MFDQLKAKLDELTTGLEAVKTALAEADTAAATNPDKAVVDAVVAALVAQGYTVTPPAEAEAAPAE